MRVIDLVRHIILKSLKKKFERIFKEVLIDIEDFEENEHLIKNFDVIIDDLLS